MMNPALDPSNYDFTLYSVPVFIIGSAVLAIGVVALIRERGSRASLAFFFVAVSIAMWLTSFAAIYAAVNSNAAEWWMRYVEHLGVSFIPTAIMLFSLELSGARRKLRLHGSLSAAASAAMYVIFISTDWFIVGTSEYSWGFYPLYAPGSVVFLVHMAVHLTIGLVRFYREYRAATHEIHRRRMRTLVLAFSVSYFATVDFIPAYGVPLYAFGYAPIVVFVVLCGYAVLRYRLVDITPQYVVNEIMETMGDALIVLDPQGRVRIANPSARATFNPTGGALEGLAIGELPGFSTLADRFGSLLAEEKPTQHEIEFEGEEGRRFFSLSVSVLSEKRAQPTALVCVARDITEQKETERQVRRHADRLSALHSIDIAISGSFDRRLTLNVILDQVLGQLDVDAAGVLEFEERSGRLEPAASKGETTGTVLNKGIGLGEERTGMAALERRYVWDLDIASLEDPGPRLRWLRDMGFRYYHVAPLVAKGRLRGVLEAASQRARGADTEGSEIFRALAEQAAIALDNVALFEALERSNTELRLAYDRTLESWALAMELRDIETSGHSRRVTELTVQLAEALGVEENDVVNMRRGALLHDIGKIGIPDSILLKEGPLDEEEWEVMRRHPIIAYEMLEKIPYLRRALEIPHCHHERWDGTGYPRGLSGRAIPFGARIFAVVDVWDALRSKRPYRDAWPTERVRQELREKAGAQFDPEVVEAFLSLVGEGAETADRDAGGGHRPGP